MEKEVERIEESEGRREEKRELEGKLGREPDIYRSAKRPGDQHHLQLSTS